MLIRTIGKTSDGRSAQSSEQPWQEREERHTWLGVSKLAPLATGSRAAFRSVEPALTRHHHVSTFCHGFAYLHI